MKKSNKRLTSVCSDSGVCVAFGKERAAIINYFKKFENLKLIKNPVVSIAQGVNGFVNSVIFEKDGYKINTALKTAQRLDSDNTYYEAYIGTKYINDLCTYFPCFVYTYKLYSHPQDNYYLLNQLKRRNPAIPALANYLHSMHQHFCSLDDSRIDDKFLRLLT